MLFRKSVPVENPSWIENIAVALLPKRGVIGYGKMVAQAKHARNGTIMNDPERWGFISIVAKGKLELIPDYDRSFSVNVDGGTFMARESMIFERIGQIPLIANSHTGITS